MAALVAPGRCQRQLLEWARPALLSRGLGALRLRLAHAAMLALHRHPGAPHGGQALPGRQVQRVVATIAGRQAHLPFDALLTASERSIAPPAGLLEGGAATARGLGRAAVLAALLDVPAGATEADGALEDKNIANALRLGTLPLLALFIRGTRLRFDARREHRHNGNKNRGHDPEQLAMTNRYRQGG